MKPAVYGLLLSATLLTPALAQNANPNAPANNPPAMTNAPAANTAANQAAPMKHAGQWRTSKMIGLDVYNQQNEKLGDINEILIDQSGKVVGYVIGVGGFLGMGEHDILFTPDKVKFVNEPVRSASNDRANNDRPANDRAAADRPANQTTGAANNNRASRDNDAKWHPDHAVLDANKDQLKQMPQFKYSSYN